MNTHSTTPPSTLRRRLVVTAAALSAVVLGIAPAVADAPPAPTDDAVVLAPNWDSAGQNASDTHDAGLELIVSPSTVASLAPAWTFTTGGDIAATPTVDAGLAFFPDYAGNLYAVNDLTGTKLWSRQISSYTGVAGDASRDSPAYWAGELVIGDGIAVQDTTGGANVVGINALTGDELWKTQIDSDPDAVVTGSPLIVNGVAYVGVSSRSEGEPSTTFRGSMVALNALTGKILWKTFTVPAGYTGGAVWNSTPVYDPQTNTVITGTGNNYTTPAGVCTSPADTDCTEPAADDLQDAIVSFNATTGAIVWGTTTLTADTWTIAQQFGPDFDFGSGPNLFTAKVNGVSTSLVGIGQKSGVYWALNAATGKIVWDTAVGPGSDLGGIEWGTATDGTRIYVPVTNLGGIPAAITSASGQKSTTSGGFWAALDPATGKILWETAVPNGAAPYSSVSVADGVFFSGTDDPTGKDMYALNAATGAIEWSFASGGAVVDAPSIVNGTVYWASGYPTEDLEIPFIGDNNKVYAFTLNGLL